MPSRLPVALSSGLLWLLVPLSLLATAGCGSLGTSPAPDATGGDTVLRLAVEELQLRSLLLLMVDQQRFEPLTVETALTGSPVLRRQLALSLGRVGSPRAVSYLNQLAADDEPSVRRAAVFALGELTLERSDAEPAARSLLLAVVDPDVETGRLAIEALGKLGVSVTEVASVLTASEMEEGERWARLLPSLFRFDEDAAVALALGGLELAATDELRRWAVYALTREPRQAALPEIRRLVTDADARIRVWSARALGIVGSDEDLPRLLPLLIDGEPAVRIQALRAGAALAGRASGGTAESVGPSGWVPAHARLLDDPRPHVRLEALDRACPWVTVLRGETPSPPQRALAAALSARVRDQAAPAAERAAALRSLACHAPISVSESVHRFAAAPEPLLRVAAARVAGFSQVAGADGLLHGLLADGAANVRSAAAEAIVARLDEMPATGEAGHHEEVVADVMRDLLGTADPGVRAVAFAWLAEQPVLPYEELTRGTQAAWIQGHIDTLLPAVKALEARAVEVPGERGAVVAVIEKLVERGEWRLRRAAAEALVRLGRPSPPVGHPNMRRTPDLYEEIVQRTNRTRELEVITDVGTFRLRLDCPLAPLTCLNFLQLAGQGFFDGLTFHRLVPGFVVQGGDPRADGYGGPGYTIRDEVSPLRYERGTLGMALSAPDRPHTSGSQFFLTLSAQPHLDGAYTAFGRVVSGQLVLDRIIPGTGIRRVVVLDTAEP